MMEALNQCNIFILICHLLFGLNLLVFIKTCIFILLLKTQVCFFFPHLKTNSWKQEPLSLFHSLPLSLPLSPFLLSLSLFLHVFHREIDFPSERHWQLDEVVSLDHHLLPALQRFNHILNPWYLYQSGHITITTRIHSPVASRLRRGKVKIFLMLKSIQVYWCFTPGEDPGCDRTRELSQDKPWPIRSGWSLRKSKWLMEEKLSQRIDTKWKVCRKPNTPDHPESSVLTVKHGGGSITLSVGLRLLTQQASLINPLFPRSLSFTRMVLFRFTHSVQGIHLDTNILNMLSSVSTVASVLFFLFIFVSATFLNHYWILINWF